MILLHSCIKTTERTLRGFVAMDEWPREEDRLHELALSCNVDLSTEIFQGNVAYTVSGTPENIRRFMEAVH